MEKEQFYNLLDKKIGAHVSGGLTVQQKEDYFDFLKDENIFILNKALENAVKKYSSQPIPYVSSIIDECRIIEGAASSFSPDENQEGAVVSMVKSYMESMDGHIEVAKSRSEGYYQHQLFCMEEYLWGRAWEQACAIMQQIFWCAYDRSWGYYTYRRFDSFESIARDKDRIIDEAMMLKSISHTIEDKAIEYMQKTLLMKAKQEARMKLFK